MSKPDRVLDCLDVRTAMTDHANTINSKKRSTAVFCIINNLLEAVKRTSHKQIADLGEPTFNDLPFQHPSGGVRQPLGKLKYNISYKTITNDYVNSPGKNI